MRKNKLLLLLALLLTAATGAWAQETQGPWPSGDCTVTISGDVMTVSGTGAMANYKDSYALPWYGYDIKTIVIESGVTSIGKSAFAKCYNLESVSIPASVTSIGMQAFENCGYDATALTVSFAEGSTPLTISEYAFNDANLKSIDIPNRVTSIGNGAFASCSNLESVSIPASVTSIGDFAFQSCGSYAEALTVSFAEGSTLESIGESTFLEAKLTSINIPNSVTSIGTFAFSGCSNLESVSIPASVTSIGYNAFSSCSKLESVSIPASVTSISEGAFRYCGMLAKVYIYAPSLTTYGANAFTSNAAGRKIYVLPEAVDTYKAGWSAYAADIEAMTLYATSVKDGTVDADKWTISPNPAPEGSPVTLKYNGRLKVKGVKATSDEKPAAPSVTEVTTFSELQAALSAGKNVKLMNDIECTAEINITSGALTIDGNGRLLIATSETRAFKVGSSATVAFKNLALREFVSGGGPAINNFGTIVLDECSIGNCHVNNSNGGGAIENKGKLYAINTMFTSNYSGEIGGAINNCGGSLYMRGCTFIENYTTEIDANYGGAIGINGGKEIRLIDCTFFGNKYGTNTGTSDIGVFFKPENYTIAGCTGATIASSVGDITTNASGTATLDYSDLSNISFTYNAE